MTITETFEKHDLCVALYGSHEFYRPPNPSTVVMSFATRKPLYHDYNLTCRRCGAGETIRELAGVESGKS